MAFGDPYITDEYLKDVCNAQDSEEADMVTRANRGAARAIERESGNRSFWLTALTTKKLPTRGRLRPVRGSNYALFLCPDIGSLTGLEVAGQITVEAEDATNLDEGRPVESIILPYGYRSAFIEITARWGWPEVPADIEWANQMQAQRYYGRRGSPEGIAGSTEWGLVSIPRLDPDVRAIVKGYARPGIG